MGEEEKMKKTADVQNFCLDAIESGRLFRRWTCFDDEMSFRLRRLDDHYCKLSGCHESQKAVPCFR